MRFWVDTQHRGLRKRNHQVYLEKSIKYLGLDMLANFSKTSEDGNPFRGLPWIVGNRKFDAIDSQVECKRHPIIRVNFRGFFFHLFVDVAHELHEELVRLFLDICHDWISWCWA